MNLKTFKFSPAALLIFLSLLATLPTHAAMVPLDQFVSGTNITESGITFEVQQAEDNGTLATPIERVEILSSTQVNATNTDVILDFNFTTSLFTDTVDFFEYAMLLNIRADAGKKISKVGLELPPAQAITTGTGIAEAFTDHSDFSAAVDQITPFSSEELLIPMEELLGAQLTFASLVDDDLVGGSANLLGFKFIVTFDGAESAVPEPTATLIWIFGLCGLFACRLRRQTLTLKTLESPR